MDNEQNIEIREIEEIKKSLQKICENNYRCSDCVLNTGESYACVKILFERMLFKRKEALNGNQN